MNKLGIDLQVVRLEEEKLVKGGPQEVLRRKLPAVKRGINYEINECQYVCTGDLLAGLLHEKEGVAAQILMNLGLKLENIRLEAIKAKVERSDLSL